jgi:hypothetical protein
MLNLIPGGNATDVTDAPTGSDMRKRESVT